MTNDLAPLRPELEAGLSQLSLDAALAAPLLDYLALLARWNATYNLTAIRDPREMLGKHLLDSLAMQPFVQGLGTLADLGTGPGLPGIPLAIAAPALQVTLVESNGKKARFLREVVRRLKLTNVQVAESRIEAFQPGTTFDAITARALATLPLILQLGGHLLGDGGRLLAMKGQVPDEEIAALPQGWRVIAVHSLHVPGLQADRHLVEVVRAPA
ncbi:16S rRNA (guanine(527)-N(7))-methyltransferase RsmG [Thermomonas paludicola]|uniref:16S rRNA (guanine(527)-N(7))-methyltransferase RsmG n=1 Tax=Thermomonas paludicola TaxID=2884874 RepID=UPI0021156EFA|nr:16S rRNA (guanine(527)-N(7))-methyltransferase RsmG [Thermomonas paludicola]